MNKALKVALAGGGVVLVSGLAFSFYRRGHEWTPPKTSIPENYVKTTQALLNHGLNDPRGGEFHKVTIVVGNAAWSQVGEREAYGWVTKDHTVVAVDGLIYPIKSDKGPADVTSLYKPDVSSGQRMIRPGDRAVPVGFATTLLPALLLIHGDTKEAEDSYKVLCASTMDPVLDVYAGLTHRYRMQTAQCLMDHQDSAAVKWAEGMAEVSAIREKAGVNYGKDTVGWRLEADEPIAILRDAKRRASHPKKPLDLAALSTKDEKTRFAELMEGLDDVAAKQWGQPGGLEWNSDPTIQAIVKEGQAIVPALIDAIDKDDRLTRSVSFGRDLFPMRSIHSAREAAQVCLYQVWPTSNSIGGKTPQERAVNLRKEWSVVAKLSEPERWLAVLANDKSGSELWLQAGQALTMPTNVQRTGSFTYTGKFDATGVAMKGEPLRAAHANEVNALFAKRVRAMSEFGEEHSSMAMFNLDKAMRMGHYFAKWDGKAALPTLKEISLRPNELKKFLTNSDDQINETISYSFGRVISDRLAQHDESAVEDYAKVTASNNFLNETRGEIWRPLWSNPLDAKLQKVGEAMFARVFKAMEESDKKVGSRYIYMLDNCTRCPIILSPGYRMAIAKQLDNSTVLGTVSAKNKQLQYTTIGGGSGGFQLGQGTEGSTLAKQTDELRIGDYLAQSLQSWKDAPKFHMLWSEAEKQAAKQKIRAWLTLDAVDWQSVVRHNPFAANDFDY